MADWNIPVGKEVTRREVSQRYGGAYFGGIEMSGKTPNVFLYSDPDVGTIYGYDFDGWDADRASYFYTGEGRVGDQEMSHGNAAIFNHREDGRALRLFEATGQTLPNSNTKLHEYVGEFAIDSASPLRPEDALDVNGDLRTVFVFKLTPVGNAKRDSRNLSDALDEQSTKAERVPLEADEIDEFQQTPLAESVTAKRREAKLVKRFAAHLTHLDHDVDRLKLSSPNTASPIRTDLFDFSDNVLYEAKASAARGSIRMAIGQLLDYRRFVIAEFPTIRVLLPSIPNQDMLELLESLGIGCVYEKLDGTFETFDGVR